jgi:hypothetical protein
MDTLTPDMLKAIHEQNLPKEVENTLIEILFNERSHKDEEWSNDAIPVIKAVIDEKARSGDNK